MFTIWASVVTSAWPCSTVSTILINAICSVLVLASRRRCSVCFRISSHWTSSPTPASSILTRSFNSRALSTGSFCARIAAWSSSRADFHDGALSPVPRRERSSPSRSWWMAISSWSARIAGLLRNSSMRPRISAGRYLLYRPPFVVVLSLPITFGSNRLSTRFPQCHLHVFFPRTAPAPHRFPVRLLVA